MKIGIAQTRPVRGDVVRNLENHLRMIQEAASRHADLLVFPELSLTGYEPKLAKKLAVHYQTVLLQPLQELSDQHKMTIGVGMPTTGDLGICISMILFRPNTPRTLYSKSYLHPDEQPHFVPGRNFPSLEVYGFHIGLAICYELSVPKHFESAYGHGVGSYLASVAKSADGVRTAEERLSGLSKKHSIPVIMVNSAGPCEDFMSAGNSAVWKDGGLIGQLSETEEGILIYDTSSGQLS